MNRSSGFFLALKKIYITPKLGLVRHGRVWVAGRENANKPNAWGMKFKADGCGMIGIQGIGTAR